MEVRHGPLSENGGNELFCRPTNVVRFDLIQRCSIFPLWLESGQNLLTFVVECASRPALKAGKSKSLLCGGRIVEDDGQRPRYHYYERLEVHTFLTLRLPQLC